MLDRDGLFLSTLDDLEPRLQRGRPAYEVVMISGLLRKLLLDETPLVDQVNRPESRRLRIRFCASVHPPLWVMLGMSPPDFWGVQDGLDPETAARPHPVEMTRDQLLAHVVMTYQGRELTVGT